MLSPLTEADKALFLQALDDYRRTGMNSVKCDICHVPIRFKERGTALVHECDCGKFTGTLRGM